MTLKRHLRKYIIFKEQSSYFCFSLNLDLEKIDFVFLDGGHSYETVKNDLEILISKLKTGKIIICDDYDQASYGVKKAVDELSSKVTEIKDLNGRLVRITI